jgi:hypothetical protein
MKNRKRESCTSGTVRDEDGNILIYSAAGPVSAKPAHDENILHINKSVRYGISGMSAGGIG